MTYQRKNGQAALEYLLVISLASLLIVPSFYIFYTASQRSTDESITNQIVRTGNELTEAVEDVYGFGKDAKVTLQISMPQNVQRIYLVNSTGISYPAKEIVFEVNIAGRTTNFVFFSNIPLVAGGCTSPSAEFSDNVANPGKKSLELISCGKNVSISS